MNYAVILTEKLLRLALFRLPLKISSLLTDCVSALRLRCYKSNALDNLSGLGINYNLARYFGLGFYRIDYLCGIFFYEKLARSLNLCGSCLDSLCIFVENDNLTTLGLLCRNDLCICGKLVDLVGLGFLGRLCLDNLSALLIGSYCILKLGSTLDLLSLFGIYSESVCTLLDFLGRLSLKSLCRVGLFCNCICTGLLSIRCGLIVNYCYDLLTNVKNLILCRRSGNRCDILLYYYAICINLRSSCRNRCASLLGNGVCALRLGSGDLSCRKNLGCRFIDHDFTSCCYRLFYGCLFYSLGLTYNLGNCSVELNCHENRLGSFLCGGHGLFYGCRLNLCHRLTCDNESVTTDLTDLVACNTIFRLSLDSLCRIKIFGYCVCAGYGRYYLRLLVRKNCYDLLANVEDLILCLGFFGLRCLKRSSLDNLSRILGGHYLTRYNGL